MGRQHTEPRPRAEAAQLVADELPVQEVRVDGGEPHEDEHDEGVAMVAQSDAAPGEPAVVVSLQYAHVAHLRDDTAVLANMDVVRTMISRFKRVPTRSLSSLVGYG